MKEILTALIMYVCVPTFSEMEASCQISQSQHYHLYIYKLAILFVPLGQYSPNNHISPPQSLVLEFSALTEEMRVCPDNNDDNNNNIQTF